MDNLMEMLFVQNNENMLHKLKEGYFESEEEENSNVGSMIHCIFNSSEAIELFCEFLSWKFDRDFSAECEWLVECWKLGDEEFKEFEDSPKADVMDMIMGCMCDD